VTFVLINSAPDGRHVRVFKTLARTQMEVERFLGRAIPEFAANRPYYSDYGNRLVVEERPDGWTPSCERNLADAFDARECGEATKAQLALLTKAGF
jgi:hypothetical protein